MRLGRFIPDTTNVTCDDDYFEGRPAIPRAHCSTRRRYGPMAHTVDAVLFDRDGTLVHDVPYNGDPARVRAMDGAREAVGRLRGAGLRIGVVTNQSGIGRGLFGPAQLGAVNRAIESRIGKFDAWSVCPHVPTDGCRCRKPLPGLVLGACEALGVTPARTVVIGDTGADVGAAHAAGAHAILIPRPATRPAEVAAAPLVAANLGAAVDMILGGRI